MRGQVGNWGGELAVGFGPEMLEWLDGHKSGRHFMASALIIETSVTRDRHVVLAPDTEIGPGSRKVSSAPNNGYKHHGRLPHERVFGWELMLLPRFELYELTFTETEDGTLTCVLPADHALPWPRLRKECDLYTCHEVFMKDLTQRMVSALRAGQPGFIGTQRPPQRLIDTLMDGEWRKCMDEARRIVG